MTLFIIERIKDEPTHFFIEEDGETVGVRKEVFSRELAGICDDLEQQNHCAEVTHPE